MAYRLGADIGGTFTDIVLLGPDGKYHTKKVPSTPADYAEGILDGAVQALGERGVDEASVREVIHGTTVASNTVLENKGAKTALITTKRLPGRAGATAPKSAAPLQPLLRASDTPRPA